MLYLIRFSGLKKSAEFSSAYFEWWRHKVPTEIQEIQRQQTDNREQIRTLSEHISNLQDPTIQQELVNRGDKRPIKVQIAKAGKRLEREIKKQPTYQPKILALEAFAKQRDQQIAAFLASRGYGSDATKYMDVLDQLEQGFRRIFPERSYDWVGA